MFTSSVLNNSFRMTESSLTGGLHLNALNGSSNVLGYSCPSDESASSPPDNAYGGLFGVSLSDNHPYRPVDTGRSFHESSTNNKHSSASPTRDDPGFFKKRHSVGRDDKDAAMTPTGNTNTPSAATKKSSRRFFSPSPLSRRRQYLYHTDSSDSLSPLGMRRFSLNIDTDRISTHAQCGSDLSLSLEDISAPRCGTDDAYSNGVRDSSSKTTKTIKNNSRESSKEDLDIGRLSITQVDIDTSEPGNGHSRHVHHAGRRAKRLSADLNAGTMADRGSKMLDKIKESKKSEHSKNKEKTNSTSLTREKSPRPPSLSRHHVTHSIPVTQNLSASMPSAKKESRKRLPKSAFSRHSVD